MYFHVQTVAVLYLFVSVEDVLEEGVWEAGVWEEGVLGEGVLEEKGQILWFGGEDCFSGSIF